MLLQKRIHDWSESLPAWQRDLLRRLTAGPLDDQGRGEVLRILAGAPDAPSPVPLALSDLPADAGEHGRVELRAIRDLCNMNCLASGQTLTFAPGLNIVFGDNGSGKSGYGRLARRVTRSGEPEEILRDVFDPGPASGPQTAQFDVTIDDVAQTLAVDLAAEPPRVLSAIATFDAGRARLCVTRPNVIEHVPRPLRLLGVLSRTQDELAETLRGRAARVRCELPRLPDLPSSTAAAEALAGLDARTDVDALLAQMALNEQDGHRLQELEAAAAAIASDQTRQLEAAAVARATAARAAAEKLGEADLRLPGSVLERLVELRHRRDGLIAAERKTAEEAFAEQRLEGTGQDPWREMWLAAKRYAQSAGFAFPDPAGATPCPVCQQDLDAAAAQRVQRFEEFITSDLRRQADDQQAELDAVVSQLPDLAALRGAVEPELRGLPEPIAAAAQHALEVLDARLHAAREAAAGTLAQLPAGAVDLAALDACAREQDELARHHASLRDEQRQQAVLHERDELRARLALCAEADAIRQHVAGLLRIARIDNAITALGTQKISNKLRELQQLAITERLRKAVHDEVSELDPLASTVQITGQASKAQTLIHLTLKTPAKTKIDRVLSDGEQRALALAFFLAEIAVGDEQSAIILDDPVCSLDHHRREYLAHRLVQESERRQVIVLTHDMVFVYLLQEAAAERGIELHGQTLERAFHHVGVVAEDLPLKMLGAAKQLRCLRHRLRYELLPLHRRQDPEYERAADRWVADLRKAYDQIIEDTVLNGTVRRFNAHVRVRNLHGVKWTPQIAKRIDAGMRKASPKAHHEALALHPRAFSPTQLEAMLDELDALYREMCGTTETAELDVPDDAEPVIRAVQRQT